MGVGGGHTLSGPGGCNDWGNEVERWLDHFQRIVHVGIGWRSEGTIYRM